MQNGLNAAFENVAAASPPPPPPNPKTNRQTNVPLPGHCCVFLVIYTSMPVLPPILNKAEVPSTLVLAGSKHEVAQIWNKAAV